MRHGYLLIAAIIFTSASVMAQLRTPELLRIDGSTAGERFGFSASAAGDVNNDGIADYIIGAQNESSAFASAGRARVYSGANGSVLYSFSGESTAAFMGTSVAAAGDVNNDGFDDVIVGSHGYPNGLGVGRVYVYSGFDGTALYTFNGDDNSDFFGWSVASAGDVNGDGRPDIVIGAFKDEANGSSSGTVSIYSGLDGTLIHTFMGNSNESLGYRVAGAGDVNNDGFDDVICGTQAIATTPDGYARVFSGFDGSVLYTLSSATSGQPFGKSVTGLGDINGDGHSDFCVGTSTDSLSPASSGSATVYSGQDGSILFQFLGEQPGDSFGTTVSSAGDLNGDGINELIVGAKDFGSFGVLSVFSGSDGTLFHQAKGPEAFANIQDRFASIGDITGDGIPEIIAGSPFADPNGLIDSGSVLIYSFPASTYPGSGSDLVIATGVNGSPTRFPDVKTANGGDLLEVFFGSRRDYENTIPLLVAQPKMTGTSITQPLGFPEAWVNPSPFEAFAVIVLFDGSASPFPPSLLPNDGITMLYVMPVFLSGFSIMFQGFVLAPSAQSGNPFFTATDATEIQGL